MKKLFVFLSMMVMAGIMAVNLTSCGEDEPDPLPSPSIRILADVDANDGYTVNITVEASNAATFDWNYGDGNTSAQSGNHSYTYEASGDYTISVTVNNGEGLTAQATKAVTIVASVEEIIAGVGSAGKTWVLTQNEANFAGKLGGGAIVNDMAILPEMSIVPSGIIAGVGLADEYADEFTFYPDGKFTIDIKNDLALGSIFYGNYTQTIVTPSALPGDLPLCAMSYQNITDGTWAISYDDLVVPVYNEFKDPKVLEDVTFTFAEDDDTKVAELKLSSGAYVGFVDLFYPTAIPEMGLTEPVDNSFYIIKEITPEAMHLAIGMNGVAEVDGLPVFMLPTLMLHLTLVPK